MRSLDNVDMEADAVVLTCTRDPHFYGLTQRTINTLVNSSPDVRFNLVVVESDREAHANGFLYPGCRVVEPAGDFNYNKYLRKGLEHCSSEAVIICNNDLIFLDGSAGKLVRTIVVDGFPSASPYEPNYHPRAWPSNPAGDVEGHKVTNHICGWCICASREMLLDPDFFDEDFKFWHQDVDYACTLLKKGLRHVLVRDSLVRHEFGASHRLLGDRASEMTEGMHAVALSKWSTGETDWIAIQEGVAK